ncbi:hypothetical protein LTR10_000746 [Elasticomyces elasticus]|nr:hypothetical protein LTR10_000746 [Elasticomyces elasticus]KAK4980009.1 hypothetical protein LTR42_000316 [Elasticomyces elasticus]
MGNDEDAVTKGKKRSATSRKGQGKAKKIKLVDASADTDGPSSSQLGGPSSSTNYPVDVPFPVTDACENITRFMDLHTQYNFEDKIAFAYEPMALAQHVLDLPIYQGRNYKIDATALQKITVTHPGYDENNEVHPHYPGGTITYWTLVARDSNNPGEALKLFTIPEHGTRKEYQTAIPKKKKSEKQRYSSTYDPYPYAEVSCITTVICDDPDQVLELGEKTCEVLNHTPAEVNWDMKRATGSGASKVWHSQMRKFIERTALALWRADFDFRKLPKVFHKHYAASSVSQKDTTTSFTVSLVDLIALVPGDSAAVQYQANMRLDNIDVNACKDQSCPPGYFVNVSYTGTKLDMNDPEVAEKVAAGCRIANKAAYDVGGYVGTNHQMRTMFRKACDTYRDSASTSTLSIIDDNGVLDARRVFLGPYNRPRVIGKVFLERTRMISQIIRTSKPMSDSDRETLCRALLIVTSLAYLDLAYIKQQFLNALGSGKSFVQSLFVAQIAADQVNLDMISHEDIRISLDTSTTDSERAVMEQVCIGCCNIGLASEMYRAGDGGNYDKKCFDRIGSLPVTRYGVASSLPKRINQLAVNDPQLDRDALLAMLVSYFVIDDLSYRDGYDGVVASAYTDVESSSTSGRWGGARVYLDMHSIEKPFSAEGKASLHSDTAILCRYIFNRFKGVSIVAIMGWVTELLELQNLLRDNEIPPQVGYHALVATKLLAWDAFTDNAYLIQTKLAFRNEARSNTVFTAEQWRTLKTESISGVWDGTLVSGQDARLWHTKASSGRKGPDGLGQTFDEETIAVLNKDIDDMQRLEKFNPYGLILPRGGDGAPYLWRPDLVPKGGVTWKSINAEMRARLCGWREKCNRKYLTVESAATLTLLYVFWWFRTGGKCHVFGFIMTQFILYDSCYSFGRSVFYFNADGSLSIVAVLAGARLESGWTKLLPTNVETDLDWTKISAMPESWKGNATRWNIPVAAYQALWERFLLVAKSKPGLYEAAKSQGEYTPTPRPSKVTELALGMEDPEEAFYDGRITARENPTGDDRIEEMEDEGDRDVAASASAPATATSTAQAQAPVPTVEEDITSLNHTMTALRRSIVDEYKEHWVTQKQILIMLGQLQTYADEGKRGEFETLNSKLQQELQELEAYA